MSKGYNLIKDQWIEFLDSCFSSDQYYLKEPHARYTMETMIDMGYEECLNYFITMALDIGGWNPQMLARELDTNVDTLYGIFQAYEPIINYTDPGEVYQSTTDFLTIYNDIQHYILRGAL